MSAFQGWFLYIILFLMTVLFKENDTKRRLGLLAVLLHLHFV